MAIEVKRWHGAFGAAILGVFGGLLASVGTTAARANSDTKTQTITVSIGSRAALTLGSPNVTFASANPATTPTITANEGAVTVQADARTSRTGVVTLTVQAAGDLTSGASTIGIENVAWTASGDGFVGGTHSKAAAQAVGTWTGPGSHAGTMTHVFTNRTDFTTGTYTATLTYTLVAP